ncbi:MAG: DoxX family protein [Planctomycetes bacterium]|nr:DoxX family protein [Planctomycetota bacterium]
MPSNTRRITGRVLTVLVGLFLIVASGIPKFIDWPGKKEMFDHLGISAPLAPTLGILEIAVTLLFLIPRTSFVGAILVTGYLGGAVWAHVRVGDPWFFPVIIGVVMWVALGLRNPAIFALATGWVVLPGVPDGTGHQTEDQAHSKS